MTRINGIHHLAINTADIKSQIEFFSDVLGAELVGLFLDARVVEGAWHGFCRLNDQCSISFVELPANHEIDAQVGVTHARQRCGSVGSWNDPAPRVQRRHARRAAGHARSDPITGNERDGPHRARHLPVDLLRRSGRTDPGGGDIGRADRRRRCGSTPMSSSELGSRPTNSTDSSDQPPSPLEPNPSAQPPIDDKKPHMHYPRDVYERMMSTPDDVLTATASYAEPPVAPASHS